MCDLIDFEVTLLLAAYKPPLYICNRFDFLFISYKHEWNGLAWLWFVVVVVFFISSSFDVYAVVSLQNFEWRISLISRIHHIPHTIVERKAGKRQQWCFLFFGFISGVNHTGIRPIESTTTSIQKKKKETTNQSEYNNNRFCMNHISLRTQWKHFHRSDFFLFWQNYSVYAFVEPTFTHAHTIFQFDVIALPFRYCFFLRHRKSHHSFRQIHTMVAVFSLLLFCFTCVSW